MSKESLEWLNNNTLVGFTAERGKAWHYREQMQGDESNSYEGAIPVGDIQRRLFGWDAEPAPVFVNHKGTMLVVPGKQAIVRSDTEHVMGVFSTSYTIHQYDEWLVNQVSTLLGDTLQVSAAGLLKGGAQAWVEVSVPETLTAKHGIEYRPNLLAATSHDGTLATTYKRTVTMTVCDNTMGAALAEQGQQWKVKHSSRSLARLSDARDALNLLEQSAGAFEEEVEQLLNIKVGAKQFDKFLNLWAPIPEESGSRATRAQGKQDALSELYTNSEMVTPWKGTAFGVVQAVNTYQHHEAEFRGKDTVTRTERNMSGMVTGKFDDLAVKTYDLVSLAVS